MNEDNHQIIPTIARLAFLIRMQEDVLLPEDKSSLFRGGFGHALRQVSCQYLRKRCADCQHVSRCAYGFLFENPVPEQNDFYVGQNFAPHPLVITAPADRLHIWPQGTLRIATITLISRGIGFYKETIRAFQRMGSLGIGSKRGKFDVISVYDNAPSQDIPTLIFTQSQGWNEKEPARYTIVPEKITGAIHRIELNFLTPTCLMQHKKLLTRPGFEDLFRAVIRRLRALAYYFNEHRSTLDYRDLIIKAGKIVIRRASLQTRNWHRYSNRQKRKIPITGITGRIEYQGELSPFMTYLKAAELVHIGKKTILGMGQIQVKIP